MRNKLRKYGFFAKFKKCYFYKKKVYIEGYILSALKVQIKDEKVKAVENWAKPKLVEDINLGFS